MNKQVLTYVQEKSQDLIAAPSVCPEAKQAAKDWLAAVGTANEAEQTKKYVAELEEDIIPIDGLISFAKSDEAKKIFGGEEGAKKVEAHAEKIKAEGAVYCDCPACSAVAAILAKKDELLK